MTIPKKIAAILEDEHKAAIGEAFGCRIRKASESRTYYVYWQDGEIQRRDTYTVENGQATLESMHQRYDSVSRWFHVQ